MEYVMAQRVRVPIAPGVYDQMTVDEDEEVFVDLTDEKGLVLI